MNMVEERLYELNIQSLCGFLVEAKQSTFAKDAPKVLSKCILSKNYVYERGDFRYEDQYFGEIVDLGEEVVWFKNIPVWGMGYRGGIYRSYLEFRRQTFNFLRSALMYPEVTLPIRGQRQYQQNEFTYFNRAKGDIISFTGEEIILRYATEIYSRNYVGGLIYGKRNADMKLV